MLNNLVDQKINKFIKKSNMIVRAITNECAGIMTQRLFNFAILSSLHKLDWNKQEKHKYLECWITDFCKYYGIQQNKLYDKVVHKNKEMTVIQKEIQILTQMQFFLFDENSGDFKFVNLFLQGGNTQGKICLEIHQSLIAEHYLNLKSNYTNVYLPYTREISSKYSLRLYEYLRSYLYMNAKTKKTPNFNHEWDFEQLAKILNLSLNSSYFKNIGDLKRYVLEPVKKDLENTDIIFTYELQKIGRKYSKIILNTHLDLEKFNAQNPELEKVPEKKEYKKKETSLSLFAKKIEKPKIIICGDSAGWIKDVADYLGVEFVLDKFHLIRTLYLGIMAGNKGKYLQEYNYCKNLINNGQYEQLINYLYKELDNHKKLKKKYFKNNKQGIVNQGAKWNIGCFTETNIWHVLKEMLGNRTYNILIYIKMVIFKCNKINLEL